MALLGKLLQTQVCDVHALRQTHVPQPCVVAQRRQPLVAAVAAGNVKGDKAVGQPQQFYASLTDVLTVVDIQVGEAVAPATGHSSVNSWFCNIAGSGMNTTVMRWHLQHCRVRHEQCCIAMTPATLQGQV